jgi:hypothetical protein
MPVASHATGDFVLKNDSPSLICFQTIELEILGKTTAQPAQASEQMFGIAGPFDLECPPAHDMQHHVIAFSETKSLHDIFREPDS